MDFFACAKCQSVSFWSAVFIFDKSKEQNPMKCRVMLKTLKTYSKETLQKGLITRRYTKIVCHEGINSPCCFLQGSEGKRGGKEQGEVSPGNKLEIMDLLDI